MRDNILVDAASLDTFPSLACGWHLEVIPRFQSDSATRGRCKRGFNGGIYQLCQPEHGCVGAEPTVASAWLDG